MKKTTLILLCAALACALLLSGCKSDEQLAQVNGQQPTVISPDVHITQAAEAAQPEISVSGTGEVNLEPDMATVCIAVRTENREASDAQAENIERMDAVLAALAAHGIPEADIQSENVDFSEQYDYDSSPAELAGYVMTHTVKVTIRDVSTMGAVIADAIDAGATSTYGLTLTVSDSSGAYQDALKAAIADAKGKADAMAEALGVSLEAVPAAVTETSSSYQPYAYPAETNEVTDMVSGSDSAVSVSTGELSITARVSVSYAIVTPES